MPLARAATPEALAAAAQSLLDGADGAAAESLRVRLLRGEDPFGEAYSAARSPAERRPEGITLTPPGLVAAMLALAAEVLPDPALVVDAGAGTGRFSLAAARTFPRARVLAVERDPGLARMLAASAAAAGLADRIEVRADDFLTAAPALPGGPVLFVGNPPFVRHHDLPPERKAAWVAACARRGERASALAGLHLHFMLRVLDLMRPGDAACLVTAAEWLDVGYGAAMRRVLAGHPGPVAVHVFDRAARVFPDAQASAAVTVVGGTAAAGAGVRLREVADAAALGGAGGLEVPAAEAAAAPSWTRLLRPARPVGGGVELGELFAVRRGQVTGMNRVWIAGPAAAGLPESVLLPCVTDARDLTRLGGRPLAEAGALRRVVDLPADLGALAPAEREAVERFLDWARREGAADGYVARQRRPWWRVRLPPAAPIVMSYMAARGGRHAFARNLCGARLINVAHGLHPRAPIPDDDLDRIAAWLSANVLPEHGRAYAGGMTKLEPGDAMRIRLPGIEALRAMEPFGGLAHSPA